MPLVPTESLVARARAAGTGVAAFNVITLEHAEGIAAAAEHAGRPVILQLSHNAVRFHGALEPVTAACRAIAAGSHAEIALHLDHIEDADLLHQAAAAGFSSVMFDAAALPFGANVAATRDAAAWAHANGLWIEAELGYVGGKPDSPASAHAPGARTDPAEALDYVRETGVDALAVAVGSTHAMTVRTAALDIALIAKLRDAVPVPLVLHGSSGVPDADLRAGITAGLTKINIGTALNVAYTGALAAARAADPSGVDPRRYLRSARDAVTAAAADLLQTIAV